MNSCFLLENCTIISPGIFIPGGEILVENGIITSVGNRGTLVSDNDSGIARYDLGGRLALPGFVNPHSHLYSSLSAGLSAKGPNAAFTEVLSNFWWPLDAAMDEESVYCSAVYGVIDAVKHGVTCIFDHHASMNFVRGSLAAVEKAFSLAGIKGVLCYEISDRKSSEEVSSQLEENVNFINNRIGNNRMRGMIGLHANFTLSEKTMNIVSEAVTSAPDKYHIHIHCGEDRHDLDFCTSAGFKGPVDRLNYYGLISSSSILAHCINISGRDREILKVRKPFIISNPESNANNRVGKLDRRLVDDYLIGTDGMSFDMISSLRSQYLLGEGLSEDFERLNHVFIEKPTELLSQFFPDTGRIEAGFNADIAVLDYIPATPIDSGNIVGHLIFGARGGKAFMTVADGNILYHDGKITFTFEGSIMERISSAAEKLHRRYYEQE